MQIGELQFQIIPFISGMLISVTIGIVLSALIGVMVKNEYVAASSISTDIITADSKIETVQTAEETKPENGVLKILGGIVLFIIGVVIPEESDTSVYYGLVWVGFELVMPGIANIAFKKDWKTMGVGGRMLIPLVSLGIALIFAIEAGVF